MGSSTVDPPEGFTLDPENPNNALAQAGTHGATQFGPFGRLAVDPRKMADVAAFAVNALTAPYFAAKRIMARGAVGPGDIDSTLARDALIAGPGALLPAFGRAEGVAAIGGKITPEAVVNHLAETPGVTVRQVKTAPGGTVYVKFDPPNPIRRGDAVPGVRIPAEGHRGRPPSPGERGGNYLDTGNPEQGVYAGTDATATMNEGGVPYSDPQALEAAIKWRTSSAPAGENWLVRPDQAPRGTKPLPPLESPPAPNLEGPDLSPDQLKLLAKGLPAGFVLDKRNALTD